MGRSAHEAAPVAPLGGGCGRWKRLMNGVGGAGAYRALANPTRPEGSVSILRRASDTAKSDATGAVGEAPIDGSGAAAARPEAADDNAIDIAGTDAAAEAARATRPVGSVGQHLDLRL